MTNQRLINQPICKYCQSENVIKYGKYEGTKNQLLPHLSMGLANKLEKDRSKMAKVLAWVKRQYQWEDKGLKKAYSVSLYVAQGMLVTFIIIAEVGEYNNVGQAFRIIASITSVGLMCFVLGFASALVWVDGKMKKSK